MVQNAIRNETGVVIFFLKTKKTKNKTNKPLLKHSSVVNCHYHYAFSLFWFTIELNFKENSLTSIVRESPRDQILSKMIREFENVTSKLLKTTEIQRALNCLDFPSFYAFEITL